MNDQASKHGSGRMRFSFGSHIAAGAVSLVLACIMLPVLMVADSHSRAFSDGEGDPLLLPMVLTSGIFRGGMFSLVGLVTVVFVMVSMGLAQLKSQRSFANWRVATIVFPTIWFVCLVESLEGSASVTAWLATGTLIGVGFCVHWFLAMAFSRYAISRRDEYSF
jgi:hypothetical protein